LSAATCTWFAAKWEANADKLEAYKEVEPVIRHNLVYPVFPYGEV
jgi:hypothetical protein